MLNVAITAARKAGAVINRASLDLERVQVSAKSHNDFVTEVDQAAEEAIIDTLLTAYPGHAILAEESGRSRGAKDSEYLWIIDPLDGTTNFIHGFPVYAVSIALSFRGQLQQAVVYDPSRNDLFYASKGKGAFLNDRRLRVSKRIRMQEALIGTGFPFRKGDNFQRYMKMFEAVMTQCAGLRRPGAASLDLCYVAAGFYDGFFETGLSPWDIAAGALIITEAGGLIGNFTGEPDYLYQREVVAGTPKIYGHLVQTLAPFTRVITEEALAADAAKVAEDAADADAPLQALQAAVAQDGEPVTPAKPAKPAKPKLSAKPGARKPLKATGNSMAGTIGSDDFVDPHAAAAEAETFTPVIAPAAPTVQRAPVRIRKPAEPVTPEGRGPREARPGARSGSRDERDSRSAGRGDFRGGSGDRAPRDARDSRDSRDNRNGPRGEGSRSTAPRGPARTTAPRGPRGGGSR
jgi:myo-inositol-1(or 4)-monophosphatase